MELAPAKQPPLQRQGPVALSTSQASQACTRMPHDSAAHYEREYLIFSRVGVEVGGVGIRVMGLRRARDIDWIVHHTHEGKRRANITRMANRDVMKTLKICLSVCFRIESLLPRRLLSPLSWRRSPFSWCTPFPQQKKTDSFENMEPALGSNLLHGEGKTIQANPMDI